MSKALSYAALVGQRGTMRVEQLTILVRIADAKDGGWAATCTWWNRCTGAASSGLRRSA